MRGAMTFSNSLLDQRNEPILNVMNFLNEVTLWYPSPISFGPGRPAEQLFHVQEALEHIARYVEHTARADGLSAGAYFDQIGQYQKTNGIINHLICHFLERDENIVMLGGEVWRGRSLQASSLLICFG